MARMLNISDPRERALTFIYRSTLAHLEAEDLPAAQLLAAIALLRQNQIPRSTLQSLFQAIPTAVQSAAPFTYDTFGFANALDWLDEYSFVSHIGEDDISVHQLVREL
ncbi:hypothetical protein ACFQ1S_21955, partial [Kibdelosporangium lantanae]